MARTDLARSKNRAIIYIYITRHFSDPSFGKESGNDDFKFPVEKSEKLHNEEKKLVKLRVEGNHDSMGGEKNEGKGWGGGNCINSQLRESRLSAHGKKSNVFPIFQDFVDCSLSLFLCSLSFIRSLFLTIPIFDSSTGRVGWKIILLNFLCGKRFRPHMGRWSPAMWQPFFFFWFSRKRYIHTSGKIFERKKIFETCQCFQSYKFNIILYVYIWYRWRHIKFFSLLGCMFLITRFNSKTLYSLYLHDIFYSVSK